LQILGLAIFAVFCLGYGKVMWRNWRVQRQEIIDEERRMRIQELRRSGQIIESRKSHDIPFGVKAIESGIEIDGIWISKTNSPVPSELKLGHIHGESDTLDALDLSTNARASAEASQPPARASSRGRPLLRTSNSAVLPFERSPVPEDLTTSERSDFAGNRVSFKPRKSSHLRYGSYGETHYDVITLDQLERHPTLKRKPHSHRSRGSRQIEREADSSAADNEHSSGASSDSDATLSSKLLSQEDRKRQSAILQQSIQRSSTPTLSDIPSNRAPRSSFPIQSSKGEYFPIPHDALDESSDPFRTPQLSPKKGSPHMFPNMSGTEPSAKLEDESLFLRQTQNRPPSPFVPGELHINKSVRKVNSGFEVLPAGTFGVPANLAGHDPNLDERGRLYDDSGDKRQSKLQKKRPTSTASGRPSSTLERP
jgi:hypothetical protein